jgi:transketolase
LYSKTNPVIQPDFDLSPAHVTFLKHTALDLRRGIVHLIQHSRSGHLGGSLSLADVMSVLFFSVLRNDPTRPDWPGRDPFVLSKGHAAPILYVTLAKRGFFPESWLDTHRQINSRIQGHPDRKTPGVEVATGSLGQGLSIVNGMMLAARVDGRDTRGVAVLGDGECDEGQVWEAAMSAANHHLPTIAVLDRNGLQIGGTTEQVKRLEPMDEKWRSFGWQVLEVDGHNIETLLSAFQTAWQTIDRPTLLLAHTIKGRGVSFMENQVDYHAKVPSNDLFEKALAELDKQAI